MQSACKKNSVRKRFSEKKRFQNQILVYMHSGTQTQIKDMCKCGFTYGLRQRYVVMLKGLEVSSCLFLSLSSFFLCVDVVGLFPLKRSHL